jgi:hypothetical protein
LECYRAIRLSESEVFAVTAVSSLPFSMRQAYNSLAALTNAVTTGGKLESVARMGFRQSSRVSRVVRIGRVVGVSRVSS